MIPVALLQDLFAYITIFMLGVYFGASMKEKFNA